MTPPTTSIDDATLVQLAGDRPEPLLPMMNRTRSYRPLIGVLAILPCLIALESRGLDDAGALWALHALEANGAGEGALAWQPPLLTWLNELLLLATPLPRLIAPLILSVLATVGIVWWCYRLFSTEEEERLGFWTALCLAVQGGLVLLATSVSPTVLVIFLMLMTFDGWQRHFDESDSTVSVWLLISGVAWGLAILAGGAIGLTILFVLLIEQGFREAGEWRSPNRAKRARARRQQRVRWGFSLFVATLAALAVSAWWILRSVGIGGVEFWSRWWSGFDDAVLNAAAPSAAEPRLADRLWRLIVMAGPLLPLAAVGGVRLIVEMLEFADVAKRNGHAPFGTPDNRHMLPPWLLVGGLFFFTSAAAVGTDSYLTLAEVFLLLPIAACAALAIVSILQRDATLFVVVGTVGSSAVVFATIWSHEHIGAGGVAGSWWPVVLTLIGGVIVAIGLLVWSRDREPRKRTALLALLTAQFALVAAAGFERARPQSIDERRLDAFREELAKLTTDRETSARTVPEVIFVSDDRPPTRLIYAIRSLYPDAQWRPARSWAAVTAAHSAPNVATPAHTLVIDWLSPSHQTAPVELGAAELKPAAKSRFYRGRELRAFIVVPDGR